MNSSARTPRARFARGTALRQDLRCSVIDGAAFSFMVGCSQEYLGAFVYESTHDPVAAGLVVTLPVLIASVLQLISPWGVRRLGSNRRWVYGSAAVQALAWLPIAAAAAFGSAPVWLLFALVTLYWTAGLATGAAWTQWISTIVPPRLRSHWFGVRNRWLHLATLSGLIGGGLFLRFAQRVEERLARGEAPGWLGQDAAEALASVDLSLAAFSVLFGLGAVARGVSAYYLWKQSERRPISALPEPVSFAAVRGTFGRNSTGRLLLYMCAVQAAVQSAAPFFNPFVLGGLNVRYDLYMLLLAGPYIGRILVLPAFGREVQRRGERRIMAFSGCALVVLPLLWLVPDADGIGFLVLLAAQITMGAVLAGYELSTFLMLYESIPEERRVSAITIYYLGNWFAGALGSAGGGWLIGALSEQHGLRFASFALFACSAAIRAATLPLLFRAAREPVPDRLDPADPIVQDTRT